QTREETKMTGDRRAAQPRSGLLSLMLRRELRGIRGAACLLAVAFLAVIATINAGGTAHAGGPQGQLTWGVHTTLAPTWFDPAETQGIITPYMVMYALHDALAKPMPGQALAPG